MLRNPSLIAALSLACAFLAPNLPAQVVPGALRENLQNAQKVEAERKAQEAQARELLAEAAQKQDLDALANLLKDAESRLYDPAALRLYALAYYGAALDATDKSPEALQAFAEQFRADALARNGAACVATRISRILARYDAELGKKLLDDLVDDFARSESRDRQEYVAALAKGRFLRPYAPSDANLDVSLADLPDELDAASIRALKAKLNLALGAFITINNSARGDDFIKTSAALAELDRRAFALDQIDVKNFGEVVNLASRLNDSKSIQKLIDSLKAQNPRLYGESEIELIAEYAGARLRELKEADLDDVDAAARDFAKECVEKLAGATRKVDAVSRVKSRLYYATTISAMSPAFNAAFDEAMKNSDQPELAQIADALDGLVRFQSLVGKEPVLEGVCADGSVFSLDDYRGKALLVLLGTRNVNQLDPQTTEALEKYKGKFDVVVYQNKDYPGAVEQKNAWKTISRERSLLDKELGGKEFVDLSVYYGSSLETLPDQRFLIAPDGKVAAVSSTRQFNLNAELEKVLNEK